MSSDFRLPRVSLASDMFFFFFFQLIKNRLKEKMLIKFKIGNHLLASTNH
jgi:hypothetical protein